MDVVGVPTVSTVVFGQIRKFIVSGFPSCYAGPFQIFCLPTAGFCWGLFFFFFAFSQWDVQIASFLGSKSGVYISSKENLSSAPWCHLWVPVVPSLFPLNFAEFFFFFLPKDFNGLLWETEWKVFYFSGSSSVCF